jgi:hypothetical protein
MIESIITGLAANSSRVAIQALFQAARDHVKERESAGIGPPIPPSDLKELKGCTGLLLPLFREDARPDIPAQQLEAWINNQATHFIKPETPIEASRSTKEVIQTQVSILERERDRLVPIAAREHWVALVFVVIAGTVFFTSISLFIFTTFNRSIPTFIASAVPGFLSKVFFSREAGYEKRIKEISSDLRKSEKVKERLETIEDVLAAIPEEHRERVLNEVTMGK